MCEGVLFLFHQSVDGESRGNKQLIELMKKFLIYILSLSKYVMCEQDIKNYSTRPVLGSRVRCSSCESQKMTFNEFYSSSQQNFEDSFQQVVNRDSLSDKSEMSDDDILV